MTRHNVIPVENVVSVTNNIQFSQNISELINDDSFYDDMPDLIEIGMEEFLNNNNINIRWLYYNAFEFINFSNIPDNTINNQITIQPIENIIELNTSNDFELNEDEETLHKKN